MADTVLQTVPLGFQWPTIDPFLFCVHHDDAYPAGDGAAGPKASLAGRELGQDFAGLDGWRMYHGRRVPGFPSHPHRGFETVTYVRRGLIDHSDSLGAAARFGRGDTQWLTAGRGIVHAEMFPLLDEEEPNPLELFQIWLNLPAADKMAEPHFAMLWADDTPTVHHRDDDGRATDVTVIAGRFGDLEPPAPPPASWASRPEADVAIWHIRCEPGARWTMPAAASAEAVRTLYVFAGDGVRIDGQEVAVETGALIRADRDVELEAIGATRGAAAAGSPDRRATGPLRPVRDEHRGRDRGRVRRLPDDGVRRVAVGPARSRPRRRSASLCRAARRHA